MDGEDPLKLRRPTRNTPLRCWTILRCTIANISRDDCCGLAAQLAFYFLLSLFPGLLFVVALVGYLSNANALAVMVGALDSVAPPAVTSLVGTQIDGIASGEHGSLLTVGMAGAIWSGSAAMVAVIDALNRAFAVGERRPWWRRRVVAVALTMALSVFSVAALALVLIGPDVAGRVASLFGRERVFATLWWVVRWPLMIAFVVLAVDLVYYLAPNRRSAWEWVTPGALLATGIWVLGSFGVKLYLSNAPTFNMTYGAIGGAAALLFWFYVSGLAILLGAELNGTLERAAAFPDPSPDSDPSPDAHQGRQAPSARLNTFPGLESVDGTRWSADDRRRGRFQPRGGSAHPGRTGAHLTPRSGRRL